MIRELIKHHSDYGRIINISTDASQIFAGQITYGASKATLEALTRSIALEVVGKYHGITVEFDFCTHVLLRQGGLMLIWKSL